MSNGVLIEIKADAHPLHTKEHGYGDSELFEIQGGLEECGLVAMLAWVAMGAKPTWISRKMPRPVSRMHCHSHGTAHQTP